MAIFKYIYITSTVLICHLPTYIQPTTSTASTAQHMVPNQFHYEIFMVSVWWIAYHKDYLLYTIAFNSHSPNMTDYSKHSWWKHTMYFSRGTHAMRLLNSLWGNLHDLSITIFFFLKSIDVHLSYDWLIGAHCALRRCLGSLEIKLSVKMLLGCCWGYSLWQVMSVYLKDTYNFFSMYL